MVWARRTLGRNWSANVTFKEGHELITSGPYAYVRHPIYSGLLLLILSVAVYAGSVISFVIFLLFFLGAFLKAGKEERLMAEHFPDAYPIYLKRVKAIIPFVL
jgi:protein-S-isoprenylcysteine O-methyltransferase Ste14